MTGNTSTTATDTPTPVVYEKGSWQEKMSKSAGLLDRSTKARKTASILLWDGAVEAIEAWSPGSDTDSGGERIGADVLAVLGTSRKGDASKIKTVAVAVRDNGLVLGAHANLSKAYGAAIALTKTVKVHENEDDAADKAIEALAESAPKTASTPEAAAKVLLSKGIDGAVVAILDALGATNFDAHRAFIRAASTEVASRVQAAKPKPAPKAPKAPKTGATKAKTGTAAAKKAAPKSGATKAKPVTSVSKGDPNRKALPPKAKAKPVPNSEKGNAVTEPVHAGDDTPDSASMDTAEVSTEQAAPKRKAVPVKRPAK